MGQEFIIKSQGLEDKINQLLPSQGGFQAGVDLSASTQIIPIVDLTETAEGSTFRQDLQKAISFKTGTAFSVTSTTSTIVTTTGYFRLVAVSQVGFSVASSNKIIINDGTTDKTLYNHQNILTSTTNFSTVNIDLIFFLEAGHSIKIIATNGTINGSTRQIADINGNLTDP